MEKPPKAGHRKAFSQRGVPGGRRRIRGGGREKTCKSAPVLLKPKTTLGSYTGKRGGRKLFKVTKPKYTGILKENNNTYMGEGR